MRTKQGDFFCAARGRTFALFLCLVDELMYTESSRYFVVRKRGVQSRFFYVLWINLCTREAVGICLCGKGAYSRTFSMSDGLNCVHGKR